MRFRSIELCLAVLILVVIVVQADAQIQDPLAKLWAGEAVFQEQPEQIGNINDHMHFVSMFWDSDPVDTPGSPHFKSYYIGGPGFSTKLARSFDGINFTDAGTVMPIGSPGEWDDRIASFSSVWKDDGTYYMVYEGAGNDSMWPGDLGLATSINGVNFTKQGRIMTHLPGTYESANIGTPSLYKEDDTWYMYYHGFDGVDVQVGLATGTDLATNMTRVSSNPIIPTSATGWDSGTVGRRSRITKEGDYYYMAYEGSTDQPFGTANWSSGIARSTDLINWDRMPTNPALPATAGSFGNDGPEMIFIEDELYLYYRKGGNQTFRAKLVLVGEPNSRVFNGDFEIGSLNEWNFITPTGAVVVDNGPSVAGSQAASITTTLAGGYEQMVARSIPILPGEELDFSFDYKTLAGAVGEWRIQLRYWDGVDDNGYSDGGGGTFLGEHNITLSPTDDLWVTESLTALQNPHPLATHADIRVIANAFGSFEGTALVDNFMLTTNAAGDFDQSGVVDGNDFLIWQRGFGGVYAGDHLAEWEANLGTTLPAAAGFVVPEPTMCCMLLVSLVSELIKMRPGRCSCGPLAGYGMSIHNSELFHDQKSAM